MEIVLCRYDVDARIYSTNFLHIFAVECPLRLPIALLKAPGRVPTVSL